MLRSPRNRVPGALRRRSKRPWIAAVLVFAAMLPVVGLLGSIVAGNQRQIAEARFQQATHQAYVGIQSELSTYLGKLADEGAFLAANPTASPDAFATYLRSSKIFTKMPFLTGIFFVQRVEESDLGAFIDERTQVDPRFAYVDIGPAHDGSSRHIITQVVAGNAPLVLPIGFDIGTIPAVTQLIGVAERTGHGVAASIQQDPEVIRATEAVKERAIGGDVTGVDFYLGVPVYTPAAMPAGGTRFLGVIVAPVGNFEEVFAGATRGQPQDLGISLSLDLSALGMDGRPDLQQGARREGSAGPEADASFREERSLNADGVDGRLTVWSAGGSDAATGMLRWVWLVGLSVTGALTALVFLRTRASSGLAERARLQRAIVDSVADAMVVLDGGGTIVAANPAWERVVSVDPRGPADARMVGLSYLDTFVPRLADGREELAAAMRGVISGTVESDEVDVVVDRAAERRWYGVRVTRVQGTLGGAVIVHTDITDRRRAQDDFEFKATHDPLTGLLNRAALETTLDGALEALAIDGPGIAVLFVDLDGFKAVNDGHGHHIGDEVLRIVGNRLHRATRETDRIARFGGDEFVVLLDLAHPADPSPAEHTAQRILQFLDDPIRTGARVLSVGASIGIAVCRPGDSRKQVLHRADYAMYIAKEAGGRRCVLGDGTPQPPTPSPVGAAPARPPPDPSATAVPGPG